MREKRKADHVPSIKTRRLRRNFQDIRPSLFLLWAQRHSPVFSPLSRNITREVISYLSVCGLLPGIFDEHLYVVNARSETFRLVPFSRHCWEKTMLVDDSTAMCFACSKKDAYSVYRLNMLTLEMRKLPKLKKASWGFESCYLSQLIYVFWRSSNYIQKFSVNQQQWSPPTQIEIRCNTSVLIPHINSIYIFLYNNTYRIFNIQTHQLGNPTALPTGLELYLNCPWVKSAEGKLICLGREDTLWTWDWETDPSSYTFEVKQRRATPGDQGVTLLLGKEMYWLRHHTQLIYRFNIEKLEKRASKLVQE